MLKERRTVYWMVSPAFFLPLATPAVFATGAVVFLLSWNEFLLASTFILAEDVRPDRSLLASLPPVVLFLAFRRRILAGITEDALGE